MQISTIVMFAVMISACCGHIGGGISFQDLNPQIYCGRSLSAAIAMICNNGESNDKKSESGSVYNSILSPLYKDQDTQDGWPWISSHKARALGLTSRGKREFVVNECCLKACSESELLTYC